ncbi:MAG: hypothetical protein V8T86_18255 [Victivallis sp.]
MPPRPWAGRCRRSRAPGSPEGVDRGFDAAGAGGVSGVLNFTRASGMWPDRAWSSVPARIEGGAFTAPLPRGAESGFLQPADGGRLLLQLGVHRMLTRALLAMLFMSGCLLGAARRDELSAQPYVRTLTRGEGSKGVFRLDRELYRRVDDCRRGLLLFAPDGREILLAVRRAAVEALP